MTATLEQTCDGCTTLNFATAIVKHFEGFRDKSYQDQAGVWTIGYGRTGKDVIKGGTTTREAEEKWLAERLKSEFKWLLSQFPDLRPNETAALTALVYNIGRTAAQTSTLWRRLAAPTPDVVDQFEGVRNAWYMWVKIRNPKTKKLAKSHGLCVRRWAEFRLFDRGYFDLEGASYRQSLKQMPAEDAAHFPA